mmetsp:Transcript_2999/g.7670  ORF Transcript_2999/g.7670 Transcript_2999/m.7670 type:complete len:365 (-) Transcript_2999:57-1151(-)
MSPPLRTRAATKDDVRTSQMVFVLGMGSLYIIVSASLIAFNKHILTIGGFPYAVPLVCNHMLCSSCLSGVLFLVWPNFFEALSGKDVRIKVSGELYLRRLLPVALAFSASLILSNQAYMYSSVAFLQMMKEMNVVLVYGFALVCSVDTVSFNHSKVVLLIVLASIMTVRGEMHFSLAGFLVQASGQIFETVKVVLQQMLLTSAGMKLDAPSFVFLVSPVCLLVLCSAIAALGLFWPTAALKVPEWHEITAHWQLLLLNGLLAFALNVIVAVFIKHTSAVAMILAGIVKDAAIVCAGVIFFGELVTLQQVVGFTLQLFFIAIWSFMKMFPERFKDGVVQGILWRAPAEASTLLLREGAGLPGMRK